MAFGDEHYELIFLREHLSQKGLVRSVKIIDALLTSKDLDTALQLIHDMVGEPFSKPYKQRVNENLFFKNVKDPEFTYIVFLMALYHQLGIVGTINPHEANHYLDITLGQENSIASYFVAAHGHWFNKKYDKKLCLELLGKAAKSYPPAHYYLVLLNKGDSKEALEHIYTAAESGYRNAQFTLSEELTDEEQSRNWLNKAAEQGYTKALEAQYTLAIKYINGPIHDLQKATDLLKAAARQGYKPAYLALGKLLIRKDVNSDDFKYGKELLLKLIAKDQPFRITLEDSIANSARYELGIRLTKLNPLSPEGYEYLSTAAEARHTLSRHELGRLYNPNLNPNIAAHCTFKWHVFYLNSKVKEQLSNPDGEIVCDLEVEALYQLGRVYQGISINLSAEDLNDIELELNAKTAFRLYASAALQGHESAKTACQGLASQGHVSFNPRDTAKSKTYTVLLDAILKSTGTEGQWLKKHARREEDKREEIQPSVKKAKIKD